MKALRIIFIIFLSLIFLFLLGLIYTQTGLFREQVRKILVEEANKSLNAEVEIGELRGNFLSHLGIEDIQIIQNDAILVKINNIEFSYNLLNLLNREIYIKSLVLEIEALNLVETDVGEWNILNLVAPPVAEVDDEREKTPSPWSFVLAEITVQLDEISIHHYQPDSNLPASINDLKLKANASYSDKSSELVISDFSLSSELIDLSKLTANIVMEDDELEIKHLQIKTEQSDITASGKIIMTEPTANLKLSAKPFAISEFAQMFDLDIQGAPVVHIALAYEDDSIDLELDITEGSQSIDLSAKVSNLSSEPSYVLSAQSNNFDLGYWLKDDLLASSLNAVVEMEGEGIDPEQMFTKLKLRLDNSTFGHYSVEHLALHGTKAADAVDAELDLDGDFGALHTSLSLNDIFGQMNYKIDLAVNKVDLAVLLQDEGFTSEINLTATIDGSGTHADILEASVNLDAAPSSLGDYSIDNLICRVQYSNRHLYLEHIELVSDEIAILATGEGTLAEYRVDYTVSIDDPAALPLIELPFAIGKTNLSGSVQTIDDNYYIKSKLVAESIKYENISIPEINSEIVASIVDEKVDLELDMSAINPIIDDTAIGNVALSTTVALEDMNYQLTKFIVVNKNISFSLTGSGHMEQDHDLQFDSFIYSVSDFPGLQEVSLRCRLGVSFVGNPDDFDLTADFDFAEIVFEETSIANLSGNTSLEKRADKMTGDVYAEIDKIENETIKLETILLKGNLEEDIAGVEVTVIQQNNRFDLAGRYSFEKSPKFQLDQVDIKVSDQFWQLAKAPVYIDIDGESVSVDSLYLASEDHFLFLDGILDFEGVNDLSFQISRFDLALIDEVIEIDFPLSGIIELEFDLKGRISTPQFELMFALEEGNYQNISIDNILLEAEYNDESMELSLVSNLKEGQKIAMQGIFPISFDFSQDEILKQTEGHLFADIEISIINLDEIAELIDYDLSGNLNLNLALRNSWKDLQMLGRLNLSDGRFRYPDLGIDYRDIQMDISADEANYFRIDSHIRARRGYMDIAGSVRLEDMVSFGLDHFNITVKAERFQVLDDRNLRVSMDADLLLEGTIENPRYSGSITLPNSRINLEAFDRFKQEEEMYKPMLLREPTRTEVAAIPKAESAAISMPDVIENLRGTLSIYIPGNNWLRGLGADLEIGGEIEVVKTGTEFELFGNVRIIRGNYELYGRRFDLRGGTVTFTGGTEIEPHFDLVARHVFRDIEGKRQVLSFELSGTPSDPIFQFYLGKELITEADAISYLIFRRNTQQLTQGEKAQLDEESGNMGMVGSLLLGQITDRLTGSIRRNLQLDVIEFSGDQNWRNATIIVGKYLSDRLYLNYERQIALKESQNLDPQRISLEYEINRYLFLQATSGDNKSTGIDLFWKTTFP